MMEATSINKRRKQNTSAHVNGDVNGAIAERQKGGKTTAVTLTPPIKPQLQRHTALSFAYGHQPSFSSLVDAAPMSTPLNHWCQHHPRLEHSSPLYNSP